MNWPAYPLRKLGRVTTGSTPKSSESSAFGMDVPFVTPGDLDLQDPLIETARFLSRDAAQKARLLPAGSVLVSCIGNLGKIAFAGVPVVTNQQINAITFDETLVFARYGYHACKLLKPRLEAMAPGTTLPIVSKSKFESFVIPLPPLADQRRIAAILDKAEDLRAKRRAALALLEALPQAIFLDMFGDPTTNERSYLVRTLIELIDQCRPITYGILMPGEDQPDGPLYVRVVDMKDCGIDLRGIRRTTWAISEAYRRSLLRSGDLLMSIRGHVGRVAIVPPELDGANITQDTARLAVCGADPAYVREFLRTTGVQRWMKRHTKGVAVSGINLTDVKRMPVVIPPAEGQAAFARQVSVIDALVAQARRSLTATDSLFASLQHDAFCGSLVAKELAAV